jgi:segregation and condensation protein B
MPEPRLKAIVESLLFVSETPLTTDRLCSLLEEFERQEVVAAVEELREEYAAAMRGMVLVDVAGGFQLRSRPEHGDYLRRLFRGKVAKFSPSALETLAIIAYRQPVTRAEVEYLRGVDAGGVLKTLMERKMIRILGKKDIPGKPLIYGTSKEFLEVFSLKDLASLPSLRDIQELVPPVYDDQRELPLLAAGEDEAESASVS